MVNVVERAPRLTASISFAARRPGSGPGGIERAQPRPAIASQHATSAKRSHP
jgi:hypothetical protein